MSGRRNRGLTLIELIIVIMILGTLLSLLLPGINNTCRPQARGNACRNVLSQLQYALANRESTVRDYPGYINTLGIPEKTRVRASWAVMTFPYIEQTALWKQWSEGNYAFSNVELLICPSDPPVDLMCPVLSYVANAGYIANADGQENKANGVFFDRIRTAAGAPGPDDERDKVGSPTIVMTNSYLQKHDGTSHTLLLTESIQGHRWGYVAPDDRANTLDRKYHFGFCWEQPGVLEKAVADQTEKSARRINGNLQCEEYAKFNEMSPEDGFPSSNHPGGVNVVFAGGSARFLSDRIDPLVYPQLMTSNSKKSDLRDALGTSDGNLQHPLDEQY